MGGVNNDFYKIIVGLGVTGFSCAKFLAEKKEKFIVLDTRSEPPYLQQFKISFPNTPIFLGEFANEHLALAKEIILSPGLDNQLPFFQEARHQGIPIIGDIELFSRYVPGKVIGVTGSNGKSTVVSLLYEMLVKAGKKVKCGGNLGIPALDLLQGEPHDFYILELSSFQLELVENLELEVACILNLYANHLDRHHSLEEYAKAKQRIYRHAKNFVVNRDSHYSFPNLSSGLNQISFGLNTPDKGQFGIIEDNQHIYLALGYEKLLNINELKILGYHNYANALTALAIGSVLNLNMSNMLEALKNFHGLKHRCQYITKRNNVAWYNDSKATNVAATRTAIRAIGQHHKPGRIILLLGGQDKGDNFALLEQELNEYVQLVIVFGQDADKISESLAAIIPIFRVNSLKELVETANAKAISGDAVLFSPACASFDMFKNFEHRGELFMDQVLKGLPDQ